MTEFLQSLKSIWSINKDRLNDIATEEAVKMSIIAPVLNAIGYNVFDITKVVPEFTADIEGKKGEKIDFALKKDGKTVILVECKSLSSNLSNEHISQVRRYFGNRKIVNDAKFCILTNGRVWKFYSDIERENALDDEPFFEFNLDSISEYQADMILRFNYDNFDAVQISNFAKQSKYNTIIKKTLATNYANPSLEFMKFLNFYNGRFTDAVSDQMSKIVKCAFEDFVGDIVKVAMTSISTPKEALVTSDQKYELTSIELDAFNIVKAICCEFIDVSRISHRKFTDSFSIMLDNNQRRQIVKLFLSQEPMVHIYCDSSTPQPIKLKSVTNLYQYKNQLLQAVAKWNV